MQQERKTTEKETRHQSRHNSYIRINLSLTVGTDMPENPGRKGGVPSTARRASPKLPINERVKRSYPQNSIPNVDPFRLKQMNF